MCSSLHGSIVIIRLHARSEYFASSSVFRAPVITGETVINEGSTLDLDCDTSNSRPIPSVEWFNPDGDLISNSRELRIMDIQQSAAGMYTCVATQSRATMSSSVNIAVQCKRINNRMVVAMFCNPCILLHHHV